MSQSDYIRLKQNRTILRDQVDYNRVPSTNSTTYTVLRSHTIAQNIVQNTQPYYTPLYPITHKHIWNMNINTDGCPGTNVCM